MRDVLVCVHAFAEVPAAAVSPLVQPAEAIDGNFFSTVRADVLLLRNAFEHREETADAHFH